jgi:cell volume regulation protein A
MAGQDIGIGILGLIILAGVLGRLFIRKTGFSDVFLLLILGALAGAFLPSSFVASASSLLLPLGAVCLLMIILDEGLHLSFSNLIRQAHKALLFGALSFFLALAGTFAILYLGMGLDFLTSLAISAVFASVAPELLSGFMSAIDSSESAKAVGEIESAVSDALSVMLAVLIVESLAHSSPVAPSQPLFSSLPSTIAFSFLLSLALGGVFAALWKAVLSKTAEGNEHLLAIGMGAILYALSGLLGASGVIAVFIFGFFLGNLSHKSIDEVRRFQSEITIFLRTFFFLYIGMLLAHSPAQLQVGLLALAISVLLAWSRMLSGRAIGFLDQSMRRGRLLEAVSARGLTSAVLAVLVSEGLRSSGKTLPFDLPLLALFVIFFTNAISAFFVFKKRGGRMPEKSAREEEKLGRREEMF